MDFTFISIENIVFNVVIAGVAAGGILYIFIKFYLQNLLNKIERDWKSQHDREIAELNMKLEKEKEIFFNLLHIYKFNTGELQKLQISAVTELWELTLELEKFHQHLFFYDPSLPL